MLALGIGIMLLFSFCSQNLPTLNPANIKGKSGIIQVNLPDKRPVNLRSAPKGKVIGTLKNGTHVTLETLNSNRQWRKVTTQDGKSGWVWAEFVTVSP